MAAAKQRGASPFRYSVNGNLFQQQQHQGSFGQSMNSPRMLPPPSSGRRSSGGSAGFRALSQMSSNGGRVSSHFLASSCSSPRFSQDAGTMHSDESVDYGKENISVTVRFRPMSEREIHRGDNAAWYVDGDIVRSEFNPSVAYTFDKVFGASATTRNVYDTVARNVVRGAMEGINGTVFAYGVTSSGKTHTMHGDQNYPGVIPQAIKDVFSIIQETPDREFLLRVSYLEIYNEVINDLLDPAGQNLRIREDAQGTYVEGVKEEVVLSPSHALSLIAAGEEHRHVGSNNFNLFSSRSHTIFTLTIESSLRAQGPDDEVTLSQLNLIDLAGSESSKTETTGLRRKEGSYINKSLLTLGTVIAKLSEGKASHIPYRDSKLTRLLQSSLSGNGRITLICTITPASSNMEETHNTLKFAQRAKRIEIYAAPNRIMDERSLIKKYQKEITKLKQELLLIKRGMTERPYATTNQEDLLTLRQQLEAGQLKMQSRLEEEEQAKAALMGRIHKLTKLILVSTKNNLSGSFPDAAHNRRHSFAESEERYDEQSDLDTSSFPPDRCTDSCSIDLGNGQEHDIADQIDLTREQVKMLAGEIALRSSSLKRLSEQAANHPDDVEIQVQIGKLRDDIEDKKSQMQLLEQRITELGERSSYPEMSQAIEKLTSQLNEKAFELEIRTADNRVLEEQLQSKVAEIKDLQEKNGRLQQQLQEALEKASHQKIVLGPQTTNCLIEANDAGERLCAEKAIKTVVSHQENYPKKKETEDVILKAEIEVVSQERSRLSEENNCLQMKNVKLEEEACYARDLAAAAATEIKDLTEQIKKLVFQNTRLSNEALSITCQVQALKEELRSKREKQAYLEQTVSEKQALEKELKRKLDESKQREADLENDLASMWVLLAKMKTNDPPTSGPVQDVVEITECRPERNVSTAVAPISPQSVESAANIQKIKEQHQELERLRTSGSEDKETDDLKALVAQLKGESVEELNASELEDLQAIHIEALTKLSNAKARIQERRKLERLQRPTAEAPTLNLQLYDEDKHAHVCKVCFEAATAAVLLPCRHFCLCQPCAVACTECPLCRSSISDRIVTFAS
ncbi:kinesin-like protein KIN-7K, chloroplastic [Selaginella moellendorffii]|uniref:kinesin-like protein KIN-7K, chloroplastic n=1 Tax=Selaginella moellendorffii TaxID=88036 RepID=UPI000D1C6B58|nr:kinesin-like protein KIN-7K, chloroplastic [Selaginella moellendorffii]|eukprot:XP_024534818.1 kinesin-like protein KIN-7K, chloroplastic [Selaginella moellendorffii]